MRAKYAINLRDGSRVFRTPATDELTALYAWIPDDVAHEIDIGKLDAMDVVNAIMKKRTEKGDFDWVKYQAERKKLNIREQPIDLSELEEDKAKEAVQDNPDDSVSLDELGAAKPVAKGSKSKKSTATKQETSSQETPSTPPADDGVEGIDA